LDIRSGDERRHAGNKARIRDDTDENIEGKTLLDKETSERSYKEAGKYMNSGK